MSTCTSELIFGKAHQNDSGIEFNHRLTLYEEDRPMLVFEKKPSPNNGGILVDRWIPHVDRMVEDSMVMVAGYGAGDHKVLDLIYEMKRGFNQNEMIELHRVDDELMERLYEASRQSFELKIKSGNKCRSANRWKVMACVFRHSSILASLEKFLDYDIDVEVCKSVYQSEYSAWNDQIDEWGELR